MQASGSFRQKTSRPRGNAGGGMFHYEEPRGKSSRTPLFSAFSSGLTCSSAAAAQQASAPAVNPFSTSRHSAARMAMLSAKRGTLQLIFKIPRECAARAAKIII